MTGSSSSAPRIGVVTVTYNSASVIDGFMRSILSQRHNNFELYVIDNASADRTLRALTNYTDSRITLIANDKNLGVAEGNNQGIRRAMQAGCDFVLLINNDTEFDAELMATMVEAIEKRRADMLVPKMMYFDPPNRIWCAGGYFKRWLGCVTGHFGEGTLDDGAFDTPRQIEYAPTCCMLVRAAVFDKVGLMDSRYFVYYDDTDFCWRAMKRGMLLWYEPAGILYHKVSSLTGGSESDFTIRFATRNKVYFTLKNLNVIGIAYCLLLYQLIFLTKLLSRRDSPKVYRTKFRSYLDGIKLFLAPES